MAEKWMVQARAAYTERVRRTALDKGFVLMRVTDNGPQDYRAAGWVCTEDEPSLYILRDEATEIERFPGGASLGEIEEYLTGRLAAQGGSEY